MLDITKLEKEIWDMSMSIFNFVFPFILALILIMIGLLIIRFLIKKTPSLMITRLLIKNASWIDIAVLWIDIAISLIIFLIKIVICLAIQLNVLYLIFHILINL